MRKRISMRNIIAIAVLSLLGLILTILSFNVPTTTNIFNGFARSLPLGRELSGGVVAYYDVDKTTDFSGDFDKAVNALVSDVNNFLYNTHHDIVVSKTASGIRIETANADGLGSILEHLDGAGTFKIRADKDETTDTNLTISASHIKSAEFLLNGSQPGVLIVFTSQGADRFSDLTMSRIGNGIFFMFGEEAVERQISSVQSDGYTFIPFATEEEALAYAFKANVGFDNLTLGMTEIITYSPVLGENTSIYFAVMGLLILVATLVVFPLVYKQLGLLADIVISFFVTFLFLFLSILPSVQLTLSTMLGIIISYVFAVVIIVLMLERFRREVALGKKIPIAFKFAFNSVAIQILDITAPLFLSSLFIAWVGHSILRGVMIPIATGTLLSALLTVIIFKYLIKLYLNINSTKHAKMGFKKGEVLNEKN